ncbi:NADH dehydrogenase subunit 1 [Datura stramonium]|uniref:NADH dehydrogenase subunit 1 n=1 Tax=Datura stramonium TaxID=4076 RepID=A0ABS8S300_DATST|nr:NADH dehydrogenase subunit 1 [Datura stramonium]
MSASRRKAHFSLWVIRRAALSDQGPGHKGPGTIQVRRTPEVTAMSRNLGPRATAVRRTPEVTAMSRNHHGPKRRANTERESKGSL